MKKDVILQPTPGVQKPFKYWEGLIKNWFD